MDGGPPPAEVARAVYLIHCTQIFFCAMYAVAVWDWMVCIRREYRLIWKRKFTAPSFLYLGSRYLLLLTMPFSLWINSYEYHTVTDCARLYNVPPLISMWYQACAAGILLIRTHAFLGQRLFVLLGLGTMLAVVEAYQIYVAIAQMAPLPFLDSPDSGPCLPTTRYNGSPHVTLWFIFPLVFDCVVAIMTIAEAFRIRARSGAGAEGRIFIIFLREGIFYFILISLANVINGIFNALPDQAVGALAVPLSLVLPPILACRLVLDLREQGTPLSTSSHHSSNGGPTTLKLGTQRRGSNAPKGVHVHTVMELGVVPPTSPRSPKAPAWSDRQDDDSLRMSFEPARQKVTDDNYEMAVPNSYCR